MLTITPFLFQVFITSDLANDVFRRKVLCVCVCVHECECVGVCVRVPYVIIMTDLGKSIIVNQHWICRRKSVITFNPQQLCLYDQSMSLCCDCLQ